MNVKPPGDTGLVDHRAIQYKVEQFGKLTKRAAFCIYGASLGDHHLTIRLAYMGSSGADYFNSYPPRAQPGDVILVHAGLYKDDRNRYAGPLGTISSGTYFLTSSGTPEKPIVIKGAGDGEAIFDGDGADNLFNVMAANYNYFEGLTIRNTGLAFWGGYKNLAGSSGLTIKNCKIENVGRAIYTDWSGSQDYYQSGGAVCCRPGQR